MNVLLFALGIVCGCCIVLWLLEFHRDLDAKLKDEGL